MEKTNVLKNVKKLATKSLKVCCRVISQHAHTWTVVMATEGWTLKASEVLPSRSLYLPWREPGVPH